MKHFGKVPKGFYEDLRLNNGKKNRGIQVRQEERGLQVGLLEHDNKPGAMER